MKNLHCQKTLALVAMYAALHAAGWGQTRINLSQQAQAVDFSGASFTKSFRTGGTLPAACSIGETFLLVTAAPGANFYACTATNTWSLQGGGTPSAAGQAGKVLSSDGLAAIWLTLGGDVAGAPGTLAVRGLAGRGLSEQAPLDGDVLKWSEGEGRWTPQADSGNSVAGYGVVITGATVAVDDAVVPRYYTGSGTPGLNCTAGRDFYMDASAEEMYGCSATNVWRRLLRAGGVSAADISAGSLPLSRGGTNQSSWVAGRCVQVSSDGTRLEPAPGGCGGGTILAGYGGESAVTGGGTTYFAPFSSTFSSEGQRQVLMPAGGMLKNLYIATGSAQPPDGSLVVTLRVNGSSSGVSVTIPADGPMGVYSETANMVPVVAGDRVSVQLRNHSSSSSASVREISWMVN